MNSATVTNTPNSEISPAHSTSDLRRRLAEQPVVEPAHERQREQRGHHDDRADHAALEGGQPEGVLHEDVEEDRAR